MLSLFPSFLPTLTTLLFQISSPFGFFFFTQTVLSEIIFFIFRLNWRTPKINRREFKLLYSLCQVWIHRPVIPSDRRAMKFECFSTNQKQIFIAKNYYNIIIFVQTPMYLCQINMKKKREKKNSPTPDGPGLLTCFEQQRPIRASDEGPFAKTRTRPRFTRRTKRPRHASAHPPVHPRKYLAHRPPRGQAHDHVPLTRQS